MIDSLPYFELIVLEVVLVDSIELVPSKKFLYFRRSSLILSFLGNDFDLIVDGYLGKQVPLARLVCFSDFRFDL